MQISNVAYRLKLPESWRIHNAFHVSLLRPYVGDVPEDLPVEDQPEVEELDEILVPEQILAHKERKGKVARCCLVKFKSYSPLDVKWLEESELAESLKVTQPPSDGITSLSFSPKANHLVATSWDNQVRCWEINQYGASVPKAAVPNDQPVLCSSWKEDGTTVFSGGCDKQAKMWPLLTGGQAVTVGMHEAPIKAIEWISEMNLLVTGSWDKTLKYWDLRQSNPVHTQMLPDKCYAISVRHPLMVVATAERHVVIFNLASPQSPLKYQTRCVATFPDRQGYLIGSIEGRVAVQHIEEAQQSKNFTFKCHRDNNDIYAVNAINFHPVHSTFATAGSDGAYNFWDKENKQRLKWVSFDPAGRPLIARYGSLIYGVEDIQSAGLHRRIVFQGLVPVSQHPDLHWQPVRIVGSSGKLCTVDLEFPIEEAMLWRLRIWEGCPLSQIVWDPGSPRVGSVRIEGGIKSAIFSRLSMLEETRLRVANALNSEQLRRKAWHDRHLRRSQFGKVSLVLLYHARKQKKANKLVPVWQGPFMVQEILPQGAV
ncbi:hypothetical protein L7F22_031953 [Adiantum nelumboides]|nr:hypothetical protein [Adiantum nelumboides]